MRRGVLAAIGMSVVLCSSFAHAGELSEKGNSKIRYFESLKECTAERPPKLLEHSDLGYARGEVSECESYAENADRWLNEVPESDRKHPSYLAALEKQKQRKATIAQWRKKIDARTATAQAQQAVAQSFKGDAEALVELFFMGEKIEKDPKKDGIHGSDWTRAADKYAALETFVKDCDGKYKDVKTDFKFGRNYEPAAEGCKAAKTALPLLPRGYETHVSTYAANVLGHIKKDLADIAAGKRVYEHTLRDLADMKKQVDKDRAEHNAQLVKFKLPANPALFEEWNTAAKGLDGALAAAKKKNALAGSGIKDGALGAIATKRAKTVGVAAKAVSYGFYKPNGEIEKNDFGIPTAKFRHGRVLLQLPNESFCRAYEITLRADYAGGGRYDPYYLVDEDPISSNDHVTIGACSK